MNIIPFDNDDKYAAYNHDNASYVPTPKPSLNGGLYTGESFKPNAAYRNFPNKPDAVYLHTTTLQSANPPPGIERQFPDSFRPGNNMPTTNCLSFNKVSPVHAFVCTDKLK